MVQAIFALICRMSNPARIKELALPSAPSRAIGRQRIGACDTSVEGRWSQDLRVFPCPPLNFRSFDDDAVRTLNF